MKKTSPNSESFLERIRSWAKNQAHGTSPLSKDSSRNPTLPLSHSTSANTQQTVIGRDDSNDTSKVPPFASADLPGLTSSGNTSHNAADNTSTLTPTSAPPAETDGEGNFVNGEAKEKNNVMVRFWHTGKGIILSSYVNVLLVFVPIGIASKAANLSPGIIFGMNAVAIIPLAGLLSHATESVAKRMGDTVGALMNVTFGNAVELIILYVNFDSASTINYQLTITSSMYVYLNRDQDKKEREALLKALSNQSSPISMGPFFLFPMHVCDFLKTYAHTFFSACTALLSQRYA